MARAVLSSIDEFTEMISREKSNLEIVEGEVQLIRCELLTMKRFIKDVDGMVDKEEIDRLQKLQVIIHDAEAAIGSYLLETACCGRRKPLFERYICGQDYRVHENFRKENNRILGLIKELKIWFEESSSHYSGGKSFHLGARLLGRIRSSVEFNEAEEDRSTVVGLRQQDLKSLEARLYDKTSVKRRVISLLGIQGIGKTSLAWEIYKSPSVASHFHSKAWVCVSAMDNDLRDIWEHICKQINDFRRDKSYLIVIDDVRDPQVWRKLRAKIPDGGPGSRIILTTRDVAVACSAHFSHRLKVLNKVESWKLFTRKVFIAPWQLGNASCKDTTESPIPLPLGLDALGKKMVEKCGGIPYLIIELANILSTVNANTVEWSCVLHGTDAHLSRDQHLWFNLSRSVDDILPLHVKQFLHLFPTGTEIPKRRLMLSWAEEDLLEQSKSGFCREEATMCRVQDLQDLNLIQAVKVNSVGITKTYCIPPDLPLLQILKAGGACRSSPDIYSKIWIHRIANDYDGEDPHSCCIHGNIDTPLELEPYKTLHSLWCFNYPVGFKPGHAVGSFLKKCINNNYLRFLRVLDLEGVYKPSLPEEIGELINLRYFGLRWTFLEELPSSVDKLSNLQTLDTKHTDIGYYPMSQYMQRLKHLYLNERHPRELVAQLSYLSDLQTLSGVTVDDSSPVKDGLDNLTNLRKLRLTCQVNQQKEAMTTWIGGLQNLRTLKFTSKDQGDWKGKPETLNLLWQKLRNKQLSRIYLQGKLDNLDQHHFGLNITAITLSLTHLIKDPMPILQKLPALKLLRLFSKSFIGSIMTCSGGFEQLRVLKIWKLETVEQWNVEGGAMPKLEEIEIRSCKRLAVLPDLPKALRELKLTDMPKSFTRYVMGMDSQKVAHVSSVVIEDWLDSNSSVELYAGQRSVFQGWSEKLFDLDGFAVNLTELTLSETKLKQDPLPVLKDLPNLMVLILSTNSFTGNHMIFSRGGFRKLQRLTIQELEELEELTVHDGAMTKLEELEIRSCKNLKVLRQMLGTLKKLMLAKMPEEFTEKFKADNRVVVEH